MTQETTSKPCVTYCLAQLFDIDSLAKALSETSVIRIIRGALLIENDQTWSVVFSFGAVVHWNVSREKQEQLHTLLLSHAKNPLAFPEEERFSFALQCPATRIIKDHIEVEGADPMVIFSLSQAIGQSIKLALFESNAITTIQNTNYIPQSLADDGRIKLSRHKIAKIRGQLFLTKSEIILNYDLLDTPVFFWEHPEYEIFYTLSAKYLEINQRTEVLSKKLETIHELFEMLADEQKHQHSVFLEWIIIWLITVEIAMTVFDEALKFHLF